MLIIVMCLLVGLKLWFYVVEVGLMGLIVCCVWKCINFL